MHGFPLNDTPSSACPFGQNVAVTVASGANCGATGAAARRAKSSGPPFRAGNGTTNAGPTGRPNATDRRWTTRWSSNTSTSSQPPPFASPPHGCGSASDVMSFLR